VGCLFRRWDERQFDSFKLTAQDRISRRLLNRSHELISNPLGRVNMTMENRPISPVTSSAVTVCCNRTNSERTDRTTGISHPFQTMFRPTTGLHRQSHPGLTSPRQAAILLLMSASGLFSTEPLSARQTAPSAKVDRYADRVFAARDLNQDGLLTGEEWSAMTGDPQSIDRNQDGQISKPEFRSHVLEYGRTRQPVILTSKREQDAPESIRTAAPSATDPQQPLATDPDASLDQTGPGKPAPRSTRFTVRPSRGLGTLPGWFVSRDRDGDGQLTLREFVANAAGSSREFDRLDRNGDGVVTPRELKTPRDNAQPAE